VVPCYNCRRCAGIRMHSSRPEFEAVVGRLQDRLAAQSGLALPGRQS
jgi:hypothetical protein